MIWLWIWWVSELLIHSCKDTEQRIFISHNEATAFCEVWNNISYMACLNIRQNLICDTNIAFMLWLWYFNYKCILKKWLSVDKIVFSERFRIQRNAVKQRYIMDAATLRRFWVFRIKKQGLKLCDFEFYNCSSAHLPLMWLVEVLVLCCKLWFFYLMNLEGSLVVLICECIVLHNLIPSTSKWKPADNNSHLSNSGLNSLYCKIRLPWLLFQMCPMFMKLSVCMNYPENCIILYFELLSF